MILGGAAALAFGFFTYTEEETVFKVGSFEAKSKEEKSIPLKPAGAVLLAAGIVLVVVGGRRR